MKIYQGTQFLALKVFLSFFMMWPVVTQNCYEGRLNKFERCDVVYMLIKMRWLYTKLRIPSQLHTLHKK